VRYFSFRCLIPLVSVVLGFGEATAQGYAGARADIEPAFLIDKPTAGMFKRGAYAVGVNLFQSGGVMVGATVGLLDRLSIGVSYGGTHIIGWDRLEMNSLPGVLVKIRVFDESTVFPAIAIGFDSQGKEPYVKSLSRFTIKSPGFYAVASKNYEFLGNLSFHGGVNLSMERSDGDKDVNLFGGVEKSLGSDISLLAEYDLGMNDNHAQALGIGRGYLNLGLRWSVGGGLTVGFDVKNLVNNQRGVTVGNRTLQFDYVGVF
jgi:hypothetical protein